MALLYDSKQEDYEKKRGGNVPPLLAKPTGLPLAAPTQNKEVIGPAPEQKKKGQWQQRSELYGKKDPKQTKVMEELQGVAGGLREQVQNGQLPQKLADKRLKAAMEGHISAMNQSRVDRGLSVNAFDPSGSFDVDAEIAKLAPKSIGGLTGALTDDTPNPKVVPITKKSGRGVGVNTKGSGLFDQIKEGAGELVDTISDLTPGAEVISPGNPITTTLKGAAYVARKALGSDGTEPEQGTTRVMKEKKGALDEMSTGTDVSVDVEDSLSPTPKAKSNYDPSNLTDAQFAAMFKMNQNGITSEEVEKMGLGSGKTDSEIQKNIKEFEDFQKNQNNPEVTKRANGILSQNEVTDEEIAMIDEEIEAARKNTDPKGVAMVVPNKYSGQDSTVSPAEQRKIDEERRSKIIGEKAGRLANFDDANMPEDDATFLQGTYQFLKGFLRTGNIGYAMEHTERWYDGEMGKQKRWGLREELLEEYPERVVNDYIKTGDPKVLTAEDGRIAKRIANTDSLSMIDSRDADTFKKNYNNDVLSKMPASERAYFEKEDIKIDLENKYQENYTKAQKELRDSDLHPLEKKAKASIIALNAARAQQILKKGEGESGELVSSVTGRPIASQRLTEGIRKAAAGAAKAQAGLRAYNQRIEGAYGDGTSNGAQASTQAANYLMANPVGAYYSATGEADTTRWVMDSVSHYAREAGMDAGQLAQLHTAEASFIYPMMQAEGTSINPANYMATRARYFDEMSGSQGDRAIKAYERDRAIEAQHLTAGNFAGNGVTLHPEERNIVSAAITGLAGGILGYRRKKDDPDNYYQLNPGYAERYGLDPTRAWSLPQIRDEVLSIVGKQRGWGKPDWTKKSQKEGALTPDIYQSEMSKMGY